MKLSIRQIEIFLTVVRTGSISRSAEELLLSQSAVSMSLAEMERQLGGELFDRPGRRIHLNDRGRSLLPRAMEIRDRMEELETLFRKGEGGIAETGRSGVIHAGHLKIAASSTAGNYLIPGIMSAFVREHPAVRLSLEVANTEEVVRSVSEFSADVGFIEGVSHDPDLTTEVWRRDRLVVFASPGHSLANKRRIAAKDLEETGWILRERGSGTREIFENAVSGVLQGIRVLMELGHTEAVKTAVEAGDGVSCLSWVALDRAVQAGQLVVLRTPFLNLERNFYMLLHREKYRSALLEGFLEYSRNYNG